MTKEALLALVGDRYDALQKLNQGTDFYEYEKEFSSIWQDFGREVLENNLGDTPMEPRKKKRLSTTFGKIEIAKSNAFSKKRNGFHISPLLQEKIAHAGQFDCYGKADEIISKSRHCVHCIFT